MSRVQAFQTALWFNNNAVCMKSNTNKSTSTSSFQCENALANAANQQQKEQTSSQAPGVAMLEYTHVSTKNEPPAVQIPAPKFSYLTGAFRAGGAVFEAVCRAHRARVTNSKTLCGQQAGERISNKTSSQALDRPFSDLLWLVKSEPLDARIACTRSQQLVFFLQLFDCSLGSVELPRQVIRRSSALDECHPQEARQAAH